MTQAGLKPSASTPDKAALARVGTVVRKRLANNPQIYKLPTDDAEIFAVGDFMSTQECAKMVKLIDAVAKPSKAFDSGYAKGYRTSYSGDVDPWDPFVLKLQRRIDDLLGIPPEYGESIQGQRYLPGQEFKAHFDWFPSQSSYWETEKKRGGQRSYTAMIFLNDVEEGGTTDFPNVGMSIAPKPGVLMLWNNAAVNGEPNRMTLHAGMPVLKGAKYIVTKWYRTRKWT